MEDLSPNIYKTTLNVNAPNKTIKRQRLTK